MRKGVEWVESLVWAQTSVSNYILAMERLN